MQELPVTSPVDDFRQPHYGSDGNFETPSKRAPTKRRPGKPKRPEQDHYETDYTTGGESCDELEEDWIRYAAPLLWEPPAHLILALGSCCILNWGIIPLLANQDWRLVF